MSMPFSPIQNSLQKSSLSLLLTFTVLLTLCPLAFCSNSGQEKTGKNVQQKKNNQSSPEKKGLTKSVITEISSDEQFKTIVSNSAEKLLIFDLYADWCMPCKILSPTLEELAEENSSKTSFYKVNIDKLQNIAAMFGVTGIPFVVYVKNKTGLQAFTGVQPKAVYQRAIDMHSGAAATQTQDTPDGDLVADQRVITLNTMTSLGNIYVYRGESVRLLFQNIMAPFEIAIPHYKITQGADSGKIMEVVFKAEEVGVFPIYCNGKCPVDDGSKFGQIIVMDYKGTDTLQYRELDSKQAQDFIKTNNPIILDVRTPNEFYSGHIKNSVLIPIQQLQDRIGEIRAEKDKPIFVYCRSGNRSTVAAQILHKNGFKNIHNLKGGIIDWQNNKFEIVTK